MLNFDSQLGYEFELMDKWIEKEMHTQKRTLFENCLLSWRISARSFAIF